MLCEGASQAEEETKHPEPNQPKPPAGKPLLCAYEDFHFTHTGKYLKREIFSVFSREVSPLIQKDYDLNSCHCA